MGAGVGACTGGTDVETTTFRVATASMCGGVHATTDTTTTDTDTTTDTGTGTGTTPAPASTRLHMHKLHTVGGSAAYVGATQCTGEGATATAAGAARPTATRRLGHDTCVL